MSSTGRSQRFRQRRRAGLIRLVAEVDEDLVCDWLVAGGVSTHWTRTSMTRSSRRSGVRLH